MQKNIIKMYKTEEIKTMNYILGKEENNYIFTKAELELMNTIDLRNSKVVEACKTIYSNERSVD